MTRDLLSFLSSWLLWSFFSPQRWNLLWKQSQRKQSYKKKEKGQIKKKDTFLWVFMNQKSTTKSVRNRFLNFRPVSLQNSYVISHPEEVVSPPTLKRRNKGFPDLWIKMMIHLTPSNHSLVVTLYYILISKNNLYIHKTYYYNINWILSLYTLPITILPSI